MKDLKTIDLLDVQTKYMQLDSTTRALCETITSQFQQLAEEIVLCLLLPKVDSLPERILDHLAVELHVDWYDAMASIEVKHSLIKNSDKVHAYMGTPYAIEQVVQDYFGDGQVEEWFEYGGQPYYFRVVTSNASITGELANQFAMAVERVKNARSRLEQVIVAMSAELPVFYGNVLHIGDQYTVEQVV